AYANIVSYILQVNGVPAGPTALAPNTDVRIGSPSPAAAAAPSARGAAPPAAQAQAPAGRAAGPQGAAAGGGRGRGQEPPPTGLTVKGEVKNFARVTDD